MPKKLIPVNTITTPAELSPNVTRREFVAASLAAGLTAAAPVGATTNPKSSSLNATHMSEIFDKKHYLELLKGYTIYDCAINNKDRYCFMLYEEKDDRDILPRTRFVIVLADMPMEKRFGWYECGDFGFMSFVRGVTPPEFVAVDTSSQVYSSNAQRKGEEKPIDKIINMKTTKDRLGSVTKVVRAANQVYAMGNFRKIYRRIGFEQWIELGMEGKGVPLPKDVETGSGYSLSLGFKDMSAFSADDMYAVGGYGDVWRFDGKKWHNCPMPTKNDLMTVCCAGDGNVYISETNGTVWVGRENKWKKVAEADIAWGFGPKDSAWFNNKLYLGAHEGLWAIDAKKKILRPLGELEKGAPNATNSGRLDISPDGKYLLTAGPYGACLHDGNHWQRLFSYFDFA